MSRLNSTVANHWTRKKLRSELDKIRLDGGTQPRAELRIEVIQDYADSMRDGLSFPS